MKILVTGGAGYIGNFMTKRLLDDGKEVIVVDSLERGHASIDSRAKFIQGNLLSEDFVTNVFESNEIEAIIHFAAYIAMGESIENPYIYFKNNIQASLNLIETSVKHNVRKFIFSSTAGVYGNPTILPIPENHAKNPENPYGESKLMVERILHWYANTKDLSFVCLRYFNAAGASLDSEMGENHNPETHIIPNIILSILKNKPFTLFGNNYKTPDGTCIRDYIHVLDLIEAHVLALNKLDNTKGAFYFNVGTGIGHSNKEVIDLMKKITKSEFTVNIGKRRTGDADELVADVSSIQNELGFSPKYSDLETIISTAWKWHKSHEA